MKLLGYTCDVLNNIHVRRRKTWTALS